MKASENSLYSLVLIDGFQSIDDALIFRDKIFSLRLAIVAWISGGVLWNLVLMRSRGCKTPAIQVAIKEWAAHLMACNVPFQLANIQTILKIIFLIFNSILLDHFNLIRQIQTIMLKNTHQSLNRLQSKLCSELKHLQHCHYSHKKVLSSSSLKTPSRSTTSMRLSESKYVKSGKSPLLQSKNYVQKSKMEGIKGFYGGCEQGMKESKQHKLKKKGGNHFKSKAYIWEMSEISTKCNDSKLQQGCLAELMKKNKQYQQIINKQRNLIQKLQQIINQSYDLNNL